MHMEGDTNSWASVPRLQGSRTGAGAVLSHPSASDARCGAIVKAARSPQSEGRLRAASFGVRAAEHHPRSKIARVALAGRRVVLFEELRFERDDVVVRVSGAKRVVED